MPWLAEQIRRSLKIGVGRVNGGRTGAGREIVVGAAAERGVRAAQNAVGAGDIDEFWIAFAAAGVLGWLRRVPRRQRRIGRSADRRQRRRVAGAAIIEIVNRLEARRAVRRDGDHGSKIAPDDIVRHRRIDR